MASESGTDVVVARLVPGEWGGVTVNIKDIIIVQSILMDAGSKELLPSWRAKVRQVLRSGGDSGKVIIKDNMKLCANSTSGNIQTHWGR